MPKDQVHKVDKIKSPVQFFWNSSITSVVSNFPFFWWIMQRQIQTKHYHIYTIFQKEAFKYHFKFWLFAGYGLPPFPLINGFPHDCIMRKYMIDDLGDNFRYWWWWWRHYEWPTLHSFLPLEDLDTITQVTFFRLPESGQSAQRKPIYFLKIISAFIMFHPKTPFPPNKMAYSADLTTNLKWLLSFLWNYSVPVLNPRLQNKTPSFGKLYQTWIHICVFFPC